MKKAGIFIFFVLFTAVPSAFAADCNHQNAQALAQTVFSRMEQLFGAAFSAPAIVLYDRAGELRKVKGLSEEGKIAGYYDRADDKMHIACREGDVPLFDRVLRHEASHDYIHHVFGIIPSWLNEGIASYIETGLLAEGTLSEHINRERLREFQTLLLRGRLPTLADIFSTEQNASLSSADYAVAWGFVFAMLHHVDPDIQAQRRRILLMLLNRTAVSGKDGYRIFADAIGAANRDIEKWERLWRREIWSLSVRK